MSDPATDLREEIARQEAVRARLPRRPGLAALAPLVIGALFGAVATLTWDVHPTGRTIAGVLGAIDPTGSAITLSSPAELEDVGLGVVGVLWREGPAGEWQRRLSDTGHPTCLEPGDVGQPVRLGLVTDPGGPGRPPSEVVAWVECGTGSDGDGR